VALLEVHSLKKRYGGFGARGRLVVNDVSFTVDRGEVVGLLGPNGAGKTTTFRMVMGMVRPDSGRVVLRGQEVTRLPMYQRARLGMGYLSQEPSVFRPLTVEENIMAVLEVIKMKSAERHERRRQLLERLDLTHLAKNRADTLSGGERRRLEITRALVSRPSLLLLDEPFSGVDPIAVFEIRTIILRLKKQGMGILLTDHSVREVLSITDRSYIINAGKVLVGGTPEEVIADPRARRVYLGQTFAEDAVVAPAQSAAPEAPGRREAPGLASTTTCATSPST
jgi:lipopolysaccharide export system ATP-binding protein